MQNIKIPQNVQVEDKLVGPLSLKQLLLVAFGGGFSYALYASINKSVGYVPVLAHMFIWLPAILSAAFALVKINNLSLFRCCLLIIEMMSKPRERSLLPRRGLVINIQTREEKKAQRQRDEEMKGEEAALREAPVKGKPPPSDAQNLEELAHLLNRGGAGTLTREVKRVDTVFEDSNNVRSIVERSDADEDAHLKRLDALWEKRKKGGVGVATSALQRNIDSVRPSTSP